MVTRTKKDLVKEVASRTGLDIVTVKENIQSMFDAMCSGLRDDGNIEIRNFGIFKVKSIPPRAARNPKTGETIQVPAKKLIHFKPGQLMKQKINDVEPTVQAVVAPEPVPEPERPPTPPPRVPEEQKRPKPVSRDKTQPAIILLSRPVND